ncbi:MAG: helix-turn-helix domain-containing protein [Bacteroidales bacterium]|nr:helix-turn-helix domain-containing protein [Bacteroidales bacterium]
MKTNKLMDEIRKTMTPEMKKQMEISVGIANRIYDILDEKRMTQKEFAKLLGKTETEVSRWLSGTHNLTTAKKEKMSVALNVDIIQFPKRKFTKCSKN